MSKKNKTDFIDEDEFLSAVSMNKKGGCVRMGKPPQDEEEVPQNMEPQESIESPEQVDKDATLSPSKGKDNPEKKKSELCLPDTVTEDIALSSCYDHISSESPVS